MKWNVGKKNTWKRVNHFECKLLIPSDQFISDSCGQFPYGLAVRIPGFHSGGPGSTPGMGTRSHQLLFFLMSGKYLFLLVLLSLLF